MDRQPTPQHAAEALRTVDQRTVQAVGSLRESPRWLDVAAGLVLLVHGAVPDLAPSAATWTNTAFALLVVAYVVLARTRWGSGLLGQPTRVSRQAVSPRFARAATVIIATVFVASLVATVILNATHTGTIPYLNTALGVLSAVLLIGFGRQLRNGVARLAGGGRATAGLGDDH